MITKEKLQELIEQGATIYWNDGGMEILLNEKCFVENNKLYWFKKNFVDDDWVFELEDIFETKKEAIDDNKRTIGRID